MNPCFKEWLCQEPKSLEILKKYSGKDWDKISSFLDKSYSGVHGNGNDSRRTETTKKVARIQNAAEDSATEYSKPQQLDAGESAIARLDSMQNQLDTLFSMMGQMPIRAQRAAAWQQPLMSQE